MKKTETAGQKPFFAAFLENQISRQSAAAVQGGDPVTSVIPDQAQTNKYPSDQEDNPTDKNWDCILTQKYPSDGDDDLPEEM